MFAYVDHLRCPLARFRMPIPAHCRTQLLAGALLRVKSKAPNRPLPAERNGKDSQRQILLLPAKTLA